jgi:hypothetical protein
MRRQVGRALLTVGFCAGLASTGCSSLGMGKTKGETYPLQVSQSIPAAEGQVSVKQEKSGNQEVELKVDHLAPPDLANPGSNVYVVWLKPAGGDEAMNAGVLSVDQDRKGELKTVTPFKNFELTVTPEKSASARSPNNKPVLRAQVVRPGAGTL